MARGVSNPVTERDVGDSGAGAGEASSTAEERARALLESWLAQWYVPAYRTARLILNNSDDAEDAVQDAFLRLWRFRDSIPTDDGARAWLYRVVVNACYSRARSELRAARRHDAAMAAFDETAQSAGADEEAGRSIEGAAVRRAIASLPETLRVPLVLRYYADLSEREIAIAVHRRAGTVKSRLHEARRRLAADPALGALAMPGDSTDDSDAETDLGAAAVAREEAGS